MNIEAEMPDRMVLEFPEGTSMLIVQAAAKRYLGGKIAPKSDIPSSLQVDSPTQNWSNIGAESMGQAGVKPYKSPSQVIGQGLALNAIPFNLGDEAVAGVQGIGSALTGNGFSDAYNKALADARDIQGRFEKAHPVLNTISSLPSNVLSTLAAPEAKTALGLAGQGAIMGGLQGIGAGQGGWDRLAKGGVGATVGGVTSGLFGAASNSLNRAATPPSARGAQFVQNIANKSKVDLSAPPLTGKPLTSAEWLGPQAETQAMALARREGQMGSALDAAMRERAMGRSDRIMEDMAQSVGIHPDAAKGNIDALVEAGQQQAAPIFKQALSAPGPVWNQDLARLAKRPAIQDAMKLAAVDLRNGDVEPSSLGLEVDPMMGATGNTQPQPTAQAWDLIRKRLGKMVERDNFGKIIPDSQSPGNYNINKATRDLTSTLKGAIPGYDKALSLSGDYLSAKSAFDQGQKMVLDPKVTETQFAKLFGDMTPAEQEAFKGGMANKTFDLAQSNQLSRKLSPTNQGTLLTPRAQAKLEIALGPDKAKSLIDNLLSENSMAGFERRAMTAAGSQTQPLAQAMKEQDQFGAIPMAQHAETALSIARNPVAGTLQALGKQSGKVLDYARRSYLNPSARDAAGQLLMLPPDQLAAAIRAANTGPSGSMAAVAKALRLARPAVGAGVTGGLLQFLLSQ